MRLPGVLAHTHSFGLQEDKRIGYDAMERSYKWGICFSDTTEQILVLCFPSEAWLWYVSFERRILSLATYLRALQKKFWHLQWSPTSLCHWVMNCKTCKKLTLRGCFFPTDTKSYKVTRLIGEGDREKNKASVFLLVSLFLERTSG